jgi:hypothetical protein
MEFCLGSNIIKFRIGSVPFASESEGETGVNSILASSAQAAERQRIYCSLVGQVYRHYGSCSPTYPTWAVAVQSIF